MKTGEVAGQGREVSSRNLRNLLREFRNMLFQVDFQGAFDHGQ